MEEIMDMSPEQESATPIEAAEPVRKAKKKKAKAENEVFSDTVAYDVKKDEPVRVILLGNVVHVNPYTGVIGFVGAGVSYQVQAGGGYHIGDVVKFELVDGKPVLVHE